MDEENNWKPFLRQLLVCTGVWNCYFMMGLGAGATTVTVPQLRAANVTVSSDTASWLASSMSYASVPWLVVLVPLTTCAGRRCAFAVTSASALLGAAALYYSSTVAHILAANALLGVTAASYLTTSVVVLSEYTSSANRGVFLTLKSATFFWGILTANTVGTFSSWRNIALVAAACSAYNLATVALWPESPYWLAGRGRLVECSRAHVWLKGSGADSLKELDNLVRSHENRIFVNKSIARIFRENVRKVFSKTSMRPILLSCILISLYLFSGKLVCTVYALDVLHKITRDGRRAYAAMLALDAVTVASMYLGCFLTKYLKRRTMLLCFTATAIAFMFCLSVYLYLEELSIVEPNTYVSIVLLAGYSVAISCGPLILSTSIIGELLPQESKGAFMFINASIFKALYATFIKLSPYGFKYLNMYGTFLLYGVCSSVFSVFVYLYLPETKNKTLLEIECSLHKKPSARIDETGKLMPVSS